MISKLKILAVLAVGLDIVLAICLVLGVVFPTKTFAADQERISVFKPPGKYVDIYTHKLHLYCTDGSGPAVIMDAGLGGFSLDWYKVQHKLAKKGIKACSYDRAGYGWSQNGPSPRDTEQIVDEFNMMLEGSGLPPPYVLVGHSFGGFNMTYFSKLYSSKAAGLVLVDSSHPEQADRLPALPTDKKIEDLGNFQRIFTGETLPLYPEHIRNLVGAILSAPRTANTERREYVNYPVSASLLAHSGKLKDMPLVVVSRGKREWSDDPRGETLFKSWMMMQKELSEMNASGKQVIAEGSGHLVALEKPDVVVSAVESILASLK